MYLTQRAPIYPRWSQGHEALACSSTCFPELNIDTSFYPAWQRGVTVQQFMPRHIAASCMARPLRIEYVTSHSKTCRESSHRRAVASHGGLYRLPALAM